MVAADQPPSGASTSFFSGTIDQHHAALSALVALQWTRHVQGAPDVGTLFTVSPRGANNVTFTLASFIFNM